MWKSTQHYDLLVDATLANSVANDILQLNETVFAEVVEFRGRGDLAELLEDEFGA